MPSLTSKYHFKCRMPKLAPYFEAHPDMLLFALWWTIPTYKEGRLKKNLRPFRDVGDAETRENIKDILDRWCRLQTCDCCWHDLHLDTPRMVLDFIEAAFEAGFITEAIRAKQLFEKHRDKRRKL